MRNFWSNYGEDVLLGSLMIIVVVGLYLGATSLITSLGGNL